MWRNTVQNQCTLYVTYGTKCQIASTASTDINHVAILFSLVRQCPAVDDSYSIDFNLTHPDLYSLFCVWVCMEGRKEMFYLTTHSTHFYLRLYDVKHMVKDHLDSEKRHTLPPHGLLFPIRSKGYFICIIPQTG